MTGVVQGGWEFVAAAYVVTALVLLIYATSVFARYRSAKTRAAAETREEDRA